MQKEKKGTTAAGPLSRGPAAKCLGQMLRVACYWCGRCTTGMCRYCSVASGFIGTLYCQTDAQSNCADRWAAVQIGYYRDASAGLAKASATTAKTFGNVPMFSKTAGTSSWPWRRRLHEVRIGSGQCSAPCCGHHLEDLLRRARFGRGLDLELDASPDGLTR